MTIHASILSPESLRNNVHRGRAIRYRFRLKAALPLVPQSGSGAGRTPGLARSARRHLPSSESTLTLDSSFGEGGAVSSSSVREVGVIGAGGSGVAAATALQRAGLDFEILEARDGVGGSWRYDPEGDGSACYASLVANTSKLRMQIFGRRIGGPALALRIAQGDARLPRVDRGSRRPASPPATGMAGGGGKPCRRGDVDASKRERRRARVPRADLRARRQRPAPVGVPQG